MEEKKNIRLNVLSCFLTFIIVFLTARLGYLQIVDGDHYHDLAVRNRIRRLPIAASRGPIYDKYGRVMATDRQSFTVSLVEMNQSREKLNEMIILLREILNYDLRVNVPRTIRKDRVLQLKEETAELINQRVTEDNSDNLVIRIINIGTGKDMEIRSFDFEKGEIRIADGDERQFTVIFSGLIEKQETYTAIKEHYFTLPNSPLLPMNGEGEFTKDDVILVDIDGKSIPVQRVNGETGRVEIYPTTIDRVFATYKYDSTEVLFSMMRGQGFRSWQPLRIKTDVSFEEVSKIMERHEDLPGIVIEVEPIREYPMGEIAAHVLGYMNQWNRQADGDLDKMGYRLGDLIGRVGVERFLESYLRGKNGERLVEVDVYGNPVRELPGARIDPVPGDSVFLTIDAKLQQVAEESIKELMIRLQTRAAKPSPGANRAAAVVMNVNTGEILAMASVPSFDPNTITRPEVYAKLVQDPLKPLTNIATEERMPPGSIFKMITNIAAIELGVTTPTERFNTFGGFYPGFGRQFPCWRASQGGHGVINLIQGMANSCNIVFYELGRRIDIDRKPSSERGKIIEATSIAFGLGPRTGIEEVREVEGTVSGPTLKRQLFEQGRADDPNWYIGNTFHASIGQGFHAYTPLQIVRYISAIANGGHLYKPYLVRKVVSHDGEVVLENEPVLQSKINVSEYALNVTRQGMRATMLPGGGGAFNGTGFGPFRNFPITVAGKTGTAQWGRGIAHGWFVAYAPYDNPQIAVAVWMKEGESGNAGAAPVARAIFDEYFQLNAAEAVEWDFIQE